VGGMGGTEGAMIIDNSGDEGEGEFEEVGVE
jgi:hypothetical protein